MFTFQIKQTSNDYDVNNGVDLVENHCKQLFVNDSVQYEDELKHIKSFESVCLYMNVNASKYWNPVDSLLKSSQVTEITFFGCIPFNLLTLLLNKFHLVQKLTFVDVEEVNCKHKEDIVYLDNIQQGTEMKTTLSKLVYVEFQNITTWLSIFNFFVNKVTMFRLDTMKIINVVASNSVMETIREVLKLVRYSLRTLHFCDVEWETSPFNNFKYIFPKLHDLRYDLVSSNVNALNLFGKINVTAPNLKRLRSLEGYLPLEANTVILGFTKIEYLQYGILIPAHAKEFDVAVYVASLPYLKHLELFLMFDGSSNCRIVGENDVQQFINLTMHSYYV